MTGLREAAQQALEFVTNERWGTTPYEDAARIRDTLRAALAQPMMCRGCGQPPHPNFPCAEIAALAEPVQEPVAWMDREGDLYKMPEIEGWAPPHTMLYAAPPQRKPLTADETMSILNETAGHHWCDEAHLQRFRAAIERAHGIT